MKRSGYGSYAEISDIKNNANPDDYHDVYDENFTDWSTMYDGDSEINIDCIKKNLKDSPIVNQAEKATSGTSKESFGDDNSFWYDNPSVLLRGDKLLTVIPHRDMSRNEYYNTIMRLGIYGSVVLAYAYNNIQYLLLIIAIMFITIFLYTNNVKSINDFMNIACGKKFVVDHKKKDLDEPFCTENCNQHFSEDTIYNKDASVKRGRDNLVRKFETRKGGYNLRVKDDLVCAAKSNNESTGGYDWIRQASHAEFRGNSRLIDKNTNNPTMRRLFSDLSDAYGQELAARNSYIPNHPRDYINTNFDEFLYGKNLDRHLYYGRR